MSNFDEVAFRARLDGARVTLRTLLTHDRSVITLPTEVPHSWSDKFSLVDAQTNAALAALLNALETLGLSEQLLRRSCEIAQRRSVTMRLLATEKCRFLRKAVREVQSDTKSVSKSTVFGTSESYPVTTITEFFWQFDVSYSVVLFAGTDTEGSLPLLARQAGLELKTSADKTPRPETCVRPAVDVNITWLLQQLDQGLRPAFRVLRGDSGIYDSPF